MYCSFLLMYQSAITKSCSVNTDSTRGNKINRRGRNERQETRTPAYFCFRYVYFPLLFTFCFLSSCWIILPLQTTNNTYLLKREKLIFGYGWLTELLTHETPVMRGHEQILLTYKFGNNFLSLQQRVHGSSSNMNRFVDNLTDFSHVARIVIRS